MNATPPMQNGPAIAPLLRFRRRGRYKLPRRQTASRSEARPAKTDDWGLRRIETCGRLDNPMPIHGLIVEMGGACYIKGTRRKRNLFESLDKEKNKNGNGNCTCCVIFIPFVNLVHSLCGEYIIRCTTNETRGPRARNPQYTTRVTEFGNGNTTKARPGVDVPRRNSRYCAGFFGMFWKCRWRARRTSRCFRGVRAGVDAD